MQYWQLHCLKSYVPYIFLYKNYVYVCVCSLLSPDSYPKESKQLGFDKTMDTGGKVKLHIANVPYEMKWQELKDLLRDRGDVC